VRAYYVPRVCVVGAESTGKTTLVERLAEYYGTSFVPEYGREYTYEKVRAGTLDHWAAEDFIHIAYEQQRLEDEVARRAEPVLICDTDSVTTRMYYESYLDHDPWWWPLPPPRIDLYLVLFPDVPFVSDEIRAGEHKRMWMHERFEQLLAERDRRFLVLRGTYDERFTQAIAAVDELLA